MLSVEDALERVLSFFSVLEPENKPILESQGQVLSEDVIANVNVPSTDNSAMDGYAIPLIASEVLQKPHPSNYR